MDGFLAAQFFDLVYRPMQVGTGLHMNRQVVSSRGAKVGQVAFRRFYHQVHIQRETRDPAQRLHHQGTDGQIGHIVAVHHVHVDIVGASILRLGYLLTQPGEIRGQDGWCDPDLVSVHIPLRAL